jgi:hypothetical protein
MFYDGHLRLLGITSGYRNLYAGDLVANGTLSTTGGGDGVRIFNGGDLRIYNSNNTASAIWACEGSENFYTNSNIQIVNGAPTITFRDTDHLTGYIHCNSNILYILRGPNGAGPGGWQTVNGRWPLEINLTNNEAAFGGSISSPSNISSATISATRITAGPYAGSTSNGNQTGLEIVNNGGTGDGNVAAISFHCQGYYGTHMHLRPDGYFGIGGWSASPWRWYVSLFNGNMHAAGDVIAFVSDERLKENIQPIENALDKVLSISGFTYNFNELGQSLGFDGNVRNAGVSAQEVQKVLPEAVKSAPVDSEYITVQYEKLVPLLIEAIKELKSEINKLKGG